MSCQKDAETTMKGGPSSLAPLSDEELRKILVPQPESNEQLLSIVNQHYDIPNLRVVQRLDSYDDANYLLQQDDDGTKYLLKVHNGVESRQFLDISQGADFYAPEKMCSAIHLQNAIMELCYEHGLCTSRPIPVKTSTASSTNAQHSKHKKASPVCVAKLPVLSTEHGLCELVIRLLTWVPGVPMSNIVHLPLEALADAGRYLGKLDRILDNINASALSGALRGALQQMGSSAALLGQRSTSFVMLEDAPLSSSSSSNVTNDQNSFLTAVANASRKRTKSLDRLRATLGMEERDGAILDESLLIPANRYHQWDTKNTSDLRKYLDYITDSKRRGMIESIIVAFEETLIHTGVGENFRKGVNHGDFNDANILVDETMAVCGAIDFGDSVLSWRVLDVAVAMAYAMLSTYGKQNRSLSAAAGVLRGYNSVYQLTELEREHLPLLMACRLSCSVTLGAYAFHMNPTNKYLLLHAEPAWKTLELIWGYDSSSRDKLADAARGLFNQACLYSDPREKIVTCYDLVIPDPSVADLLASVRVMSIHSQASLEPKKKRRKTKCDGLLPTIVFATSEPKHFLEAKRLLRPDVVDDEAAPRLKYRLEARELTSSRAAGDFIEGSRELCALAAEETGCAVIVEVTGLCFAALKGLPGPYTSSFIDTCGVADLVKTIAAFEDKTAYARTVVCFSPGVGCDPVFFDGRTSGLVVSPRGENGFGFDSIFQPSDGGECTYAEMQPIEKDSLSHRARAFSQLSNYLRKFRNEIASQL